MFKAVVFDLYETLITEWVSDKYLSSQCAADLGVDPALYRRIWESCHDEMDTGSITYRQALEMVLKEAGKPLDEAVLKRCTQKRTATKLQCFAKMDAQVMEMLHGLKQKGLQLLLLSNCSEEEITGFSDSPLAQHFDAVCFSYQAGLKKPDPAIYKLCAGMVSLSPEDCLFVGDRGSRELYGAAQSGMTPLRALWFPEKYHPSIVSMPFPAAHTPLEVERYLQQHKSEEEENGTEKNI